VDTANESLADVVSDVTDGKGADITFEVTWFAHMSCVTQSPSLEVVEYLGSEQLVHVRLQDLELVVKLPAEPRLAAGRRAVFSVPLARLSFFDEQTRGRFDSAR
jgi:ABC-type sugar transport system ATPase subunit